MAFSVKIEGLDKLNAFLKKVPKQIRDEVNEEFVEVGRKTVGKMKRDAPKNIGALKNSIVADTKNELRLEITAQKGYAPYMEWGTKSKARVPGELSAYASQFRGPTGISDTDPLIALTEWVKRKGISAKWGIKGKNKAKRDRSAAWIVFRKIMKFGVKPQSFFFNDKTGKSRLPEIKKELIAKLKNIKL